MGEVEKKEGEAAKTPETPVAAPAASPTEVSENRINITWPMKLITDGALTKTLTYASASSSLASEKLEAKGNMTLDWPLTYTNREIFEFRFPFKIAGSLNWEDYEYDMQLASSTSREIKNLTVNPDVPFVFKFYLDKYTSIELPLYLTSTNSFKWSDQDDSTGNTTVYTQNNSYSLNNGNNIVFATRDKDDTLSFQNSVPIGYSFGINKQTTSPNSANDSPSNYKTASYRLGNTATINFLKNYEFLASSINASYAFSNSTKFDTEPSYLSDVSSHNYNFELSTLKSKLSFSSSTSETFKPNYSITKNPYDVSFSTTLLPYFELTNAYRYSRKDSKAMSNTLTIKGSTTKAPTTTSTTTTTTTAASTTVDPASPNNPLTVDSPVPTQTKRTGNEIYITDNFWINSFNFNLTWSRDYYSPQNDRMNYDFTMNLNLGEDWIFDMGFRGRNSQLYKYTAKYREDFPTAEHREFFDDLVDSLQFWKSVEERTKPYFKMESFVFNIKHFLHKWVMELQTTFTPRQDATTKAFYFESQILFKLTLTELPSLNPPEVKKTFGKQPTN
ncbi:MAG: hypothetical protein CVV50_03625 [Spirochaetae bacterium HGW-Spirochaetae-6]|nr:MAG: hypothetical protein CVV50_03625 [Spirochaetae bacterium HGW-Spirochaetae-6]